MDTNPTDGGFIPYPTNRVVGTISDEGHANAALDALVKAGFDRHAIDLLHGDSDLTRLDPAGSEHGVLQRLQRALIRTGGAVEEHKYLMRHVDDIRSGRFVLMILAPQREARTIAADILGAHGAEFIGFYGRWMWEGLAPSGRRIIGTAKCPDERQWTSAYATPTAHDDATGSGRVTG